MSILLILSALLLPAMYQKWPSSSTRGEFLWQAGREFISLSNGARDPQRRLVRLCPQRLSNKKKNARRICQTRTTKQPKRNAVSKHPIPSVMCQASAWKLKSNQTHDPVITVIHRTALGLYEANVPHLVLYNCYSQGHSFEIATLHLSHCPWRLHANLMHALVFYLKLNHT